MSIYAPLKKGRRRIGWKELNAGICRIMQDYCGQYKSRNTLEEGLRLLRELRQSEASTVYAANPHELVRSLECQSIITIGEAIVHASLARKISSRFLNFVRLDFPATDPAERQELLPIKLSGNEPVVGETPLDYHLRQPYAATYEENYRIHCDL